MKPADSRRPHPFRGHLRRRAAIGLGLVLLVLVGIRAALPRVILHYANETLDKIPEYRGHIGDVDLALFRGAYQIENVRLDKVSGESRTPFFSAEAIDLSVEWMALFHGALVGEIELRKPKVNFVIAASKRASQTGIDSSWQDRIQDLFPLQINRFAIRGGEIHFADLTRVPRFDIHLDHIETLATGLKSRPVQGDVLPARLETTATAMDHASLQINMRINPLARYPTFDMDAQLVDLKLATLNDFLKAYAKIDVEKGAFSVFAELAAKEGFFKGYVKPLAKDVKIFSPEEKDEGGFLASTWEALVAGVESVFENQEKRQVATQIPLAGKWSDPGAGIWTSVGFLLRNAFIRALSPNISHSIQFKDAGEKK